MNSCQRCVAGAINGSPKPHLGYATDDLIHAVGYGRRIAGAKEIGLWDADLFTEQQNVKDAKLLSGHVTSQTDSDATIVAQIGIDYRDGSV